MATLGVLTYTLPPGLKVKNNNFNKILITSSNNNTNNNNNNINNNNILINNNNSVVNKTKDLRMIENNTPVMRKKQKLVPLAESNVANIQVTTVGQPPAKKTKLLNSSAKTNVVEVAKINPSENSTPGSGRKSLPPPQAVARRNARERNRVKQVNNGFAALRQRIPEEVAEAFEAAGCGRGTAKKLSKVETLRMAVEYIRSLERLLGLENSPSIFTDEDDAIVIKSESGPVSPNEENYEDSNYDPDESSIYYSDNLPDVTMLNGQQYLRIPGTNTYQLLTPDVFENEENFQPMAINNCPVSDMGLSPVMNFNQARSDEIPSLSLEQLAPAQITTSAPSSPLPQSPTSSSLSPAGHLVQSTVSNHQYILSQLQMHQDQLQMQQQQQIQQQQQQESRIKLIEKHQLSSSNILYRTELAPNCPSPHEDLSNIQGYYESHPGANDRQLYDGFVLLKKEIVQDDNTVLLDTSSAVLSDESMMEAIDWWDSHTPKSDSSGLL